MNAVILYTTKHGTTAKCAGILKERTSEDIEIVNLMGIKDFSIEPYDTIILGASVYMGKIQPEMTAFCRNYEVLLLKREIGLFICSGDHGERGREYLKLFGESLYKHAISRKLFGDEVYWNRLNFIEKLAMRIIKKTNTSTSDIETGAIDELLAEMKLQT